jgi:enoyl-CoA hydratase
VGPMAEPVLLQTIVDGIATVTLNRPERRNALNRELMHALLDSITALDADPQVHAVIVTGTDPAFCAGVDLKEAADVTGDGGLLGGTTRFPGRGLLPEVSVPLIGAVNGPAATGGLEVALSCDFLIASDRARFADTHARVGVMPGGGMTVRLAKWVGLARAKQMSITGNYIDAATALTWGLVNEVVDHTHLLDRATEIARDVVSNDPRGVRTVLSMYDTAADILDTGSWETERRIAREWAAQGIDRGELARRRDAVVQRGRSSVGDNSAS